MKKHIRERQEFIKKTLDTKGTINRADITIKFEVSDATSANDLAFFIKNNKDYIVYDFSEKTYKKCLTSV